jgi:hypothetical protein
LVLVVAAGCGSDKEVDDAGVAPDAPASSISLVPSFTPDNFPMSSMDFPLHPELSRHCARTADFYLISANPTQVLGATSTDPAFSLDTDPDIQCTGGPQCVIRFCFTSTTPGAHVTTIDFATTSGSATFDLHATVLDPISNVALAVAVATYESGFANLVGLRAGGAVAAADGLVLWSRDQAIQIDATGVETDHSLYAMAFGQYLDTTSAMAVAPNQDIYAVVGDLDNSNSGVLERLHPDGSQYPDYGTNGLAPLPLGYGYGYGGVVVQPNGRPIAIGSDPSTAVAMSNGVLDPTYGTSGVTVIADQIAAPSAVDLEGRLYVCGASGCIRLTADGMIDHAFSFGGPVQAIAIDMDDHANVGGASGVTVLDDAGGTIASYSSADVVDLAFDVTGRAYVTDRAGDVERYTIMHVLDTRLGFGTTSGVRCPVAGTCWLFGRNQHVIEPTEEVSADYPLELYALRLLD